MGFFHQPKIRKFNYQPVFYDERKEALKNKIDAAERERAGEYVPGASIKGSFRRMEVARKEIKYTPFMRFLSILGIAAVLVAAVYMAQLMGLLF
ncbi:MAG: hypothetical protein IKK19_02285 [Bacteroidales bacterium]|nr:hypothetical protein [Bacteroidales bacterium]MBQ8645119.1 hypothetical protein [Bacteroidales bacterium]MBR1950413.1 hypothetical protein [Bacteroidales bacterium]MBR2438213.1 hypothetical protein [Bacteroidales bacterium]MBR4088116.1 hypothetical protein [Bacteroidales bacterium]